APRQPSPARAANRDRAPLHAPASPSAGSRPARRAHEHTAAEQSDAGGTGLGRSPSAGPSGPSPSPGPSPNPSPTPPVVRGKNSHTHAYLKYAADRHRVRWAARLLGAREKANEIRWIG